MADSRNNETYTGDTLVKAPDVHGSYAVKAGTRHIKGMAFRKREHVTAVTLPEGLLTIGDAAFSHCKTLGEVVLPASIETIGTAAFCNTGVRTVTFLGVPESIEQSAFGNCKELAKVIIPKGTKKVFMKWFDELLLTEVVKKEKHVDEGINQDLFGNHYEVYEQQNLFGAAEREPEIQRDLFGEPMVQRAELNYNHHDYAWVYGDEVNLTELFSRRTYLFGNPSYQFRKKCLFVFMKSKLASTIKKEKVYSIPANTTYFTEKYREKYGDSKVRIFLMVSDHWTTARFFDEVELDVVMEKSIQVRSLFFR